MALEQITFNLGALDDAANSGKNYVSGQVFEVFNIDDTYADIFADSAGTIPIDQSGIQNISNSDGECKFFIDKGFYSIKSGGKVRQLNANFSFEFETVSDAVNARFISLIDGRRVYIKERLAYFIVQSSGVGVGTEGLNILTSNSNLNYELELETKDNIVSSTSLGVTDSNAETTLPLVNSLCGIKGWTLTARTLNASFQDTVRLRQSHSMYFDGSVFTINKETSGRGIELASDDSGNLPTKNAQLVISGLHIKPGAFVSANHNCDALSIGTHPDQTQGESSKISYKRIIIEGGFSWNVNLLDDMYLNTFYDFDIAEGYNGNVRVFTQNNAGESIRFVGGVIDGAHNDTNTAVNFQIEPNANADIYFLGTSMDYGDKQIIMRSGSIFGSIHMEGNSSLTDIELIETNNQPIMLHLTGGTIATGPLGGGPNDPPPEPAEGKASRIDVTGGKCTVILDGISNSLRGRGDTELVRVLSGTPTVSCRNIEYDPEPNNVAKTSYYLNRLDNGGFEAGTLRGWTTTGNITASTENPFEGTYSMKLVGTTGASFSALQKTYPSGNSKFIAAFKVQITDYTSGSIEMVLIFRNSKGDTVGTRTIPVSASSVGGWIDIEDSAPLVASTYEMEIQAKGTNFIGTGYVDKVLVDFI